MGDPEDGRSYTLGQLQEICVGRYTPGQIHEYWRGTCQPLGVSVPARLKIIDVQTLLCSVKHMSMDQWLGIVDDEGMLLCYGDELLQCYDTVEQVVRVYARVGPDGSTSLDPMFFKDIHIRKLGHRRMF